MYTSPLDTARRVTNQSAVGGLCEIWKKDCVSKGIVLTALVYGRTHVCGIWCFVSLETCPKAGFKAENSHQKVIVRVAALP